MKSFVAAALAATAIASPLAVRQSDNIDPVVLQFALTLEHLENVFYKEALKKFSQKDFTDAGFPADYRSKLEFIASDEESHVKLLTAALQGIGQKPVAACTYKFPYTDVKSFVGLSSVIEGVGTSAYLGGAPLITSKDYLTVAGSILVAEALHTSYQRNSVGQIPFANAYGTPLDPMSVFSIAAPFFDVCPSDNTPLPFTTFPALTYNAPAKAKRDWVPWTSAASSAKTSSTSSTKTWTTEKKATTTTKSVKTTEYYNGAKTTGYNTWEPKPTGYNNGAKPTDCASYNGGDWAPVNGKPGQWEQVNGGKGGAYTPTPAPAGPAAGAKVSFTASGDVPAGSFITFVSGLVITSVPAQISGKTVTAAIPDTVSGQTYVFVSSSDQEKTFSDKAVLFGPAIIEVAPPAPAIDYNYRK